MKRHLVASLVLASALGAPAALAGDPSNAIILLPVQRELGTFGLEYEHITGNTSVYLSGGLRNPVRSVRPIDAMLDVGLRFYPFAKAPRWFFIGPQIGVEYVNDTSEAVQYSNLNGKVAGFRVGAAAGISILLGDIFLITVSGGGEYFRDYVVDTDTGRLPTDQQNLGYFYKGGVGFAF